MDGRVPPHRNDASDLEGLSRLEDVEEESVSELADAGQGFEADVVAGVERAANRPERPVRTHEDLRTDDFPPERQNRPAGADEEAA